MVPKGFDLRYAAGNLAGHLAPLRQSLIDCSPSGRTGSFKCLAHERRELTAEAIWFFEKWKMTRAVMER
jgi:hypothetical protein